MSLPHAGLTQAWVSLPHAAIPSAIPSVVAACRNVTGHDFSVLDELALIRSACYLEVLLVWRQRRDASADEARMSGADVDTSCITTSLTKHACQVLGALAQGLLKVIRQHLL